jgi:uncharacterized protein (DUF1330 family)
MRMLQINDQYRRLAAASIAACGGRYLARGAKAEIVEGDPTTRRIVIVEFPTLEIAQQWYASNEYAKALGHRSRALRRRLMFVEVLPPLPETLKLGQEKRLKPTD